MTSRSYTAGEQRHCTKHRVISKLKQCLNIALSFRLVAAQHVEGTADCCKQQSVKLENKIID